MFYTRPETMKNRQITTWLLGAILFFPTLAISAESDDKNVAPQEQIIQPQLERRDVKVPHINVDDIEV